MTVPSASKTAGHRKRLRERFRKTGLAGFHDYEVVELLLTLGTPRKDCKGPAKEALKKFKSLKGVLEASPERLREIKGLGPSNIFGLRLVREMATVYLKERAKEKPLTASPRAVVDYLRQSMAGLRKEIFQVLYLNNANRVIETETLFTGTVDQAAIHPREVIASALKRNASRLIFAHNHTAGTLKPSREDIEITARLKDACATVGIEVLDHLIIGEGGYFSLREHNLL